mgnify:CR=1 FL=1
MTAHSTRNRKPSKRAGLHVRSHVKAGMVAPPRQMKIEKDIADDAYSR